MNKACYRNVLTKYNAYKVTTIDDNDTRMKKNERTRRVIIGVEEHPALFHTSALLYPCELFSLFANSKREKRDTARAKLSLAHSQMCFHGLYQAWIRNTEHKHTNPGGLPDALTNVLYYETIIEFINSSIRSANSSGVTPSVTSNLRRVLL